MIPLRAKILASAVTRIELLLWLFALGWLRVALDPSPMSIVGRVLDPQGAGSLALPVIAVMCVIGAAGILGCQLWARRAFLYVSAFWWALVWTLIYLKATPVHDGPWWLSYLPSDSAAYSYGLIATVALIEAVHTGRRERSCAP